MKRILITLIPPLAIVAVFLLKDYILAVTEYLPPCRFYMATGLLCPGCGNTRALKAFLSFDIISAVRYNITLPLILGALVLFYIQTLVSVWYKPVILFPKKISVYIVLCILLILYFIIRNIFNFMP